LCRRRGPGSQHFCFFPLLSFPLVYFLSHKYALSATDSILVRNSDLVGLDCCRSIACCIDEFMFLFLFSCTVHVVVCCYHCHRRLDSCLSIGTNGDILRKESSHRFFKKSFCRWSFLVEAIADIDRD
jgi:hypothetical protein